jgi:hypothetical protein
MISGRGRRKRTYGWHWNSTFPTLATRLSLTTSRPPDLLTCCSLGASLAIALSAAARRLGKNLSAMAAAAVSAASEEPCPEEEATRARGLAPVLRSMGPQGKGSRRSTSSSPSSGLGEKGGSGDQRETQPAAWNILLLGPGWRAPAPRGRPRGEETERPRKVEERDRGGGLGEGAGVDESVPWWRLWGGRYAIANAAAANCHPTPARMVWSGPRRWWGGNGKVAECEAMMAVRGRFIYRVHRFKKSVEFADFF